MRLGQWTRPVPDKCMAHSGVQRRWGHQICPWMQRFCSVVHFPACPSPHYIPSHVHPFQDRDSGAALQPRELLFNTFFAFSFVTARCQISSTPLSACLLLRGLCTDAHGVVYILCLHVVYIMCNFYPEVLKQLVRRCGKGTRNTNILPTFHSRLCIYVCIQLDRIFKGLNRGIVLAMVGLKESCCGGPN